MSGVKAYVVDCNLLSSGKEVTRDVDVAVVLLSDYNELYTSWGAVKHNLTKTDKVVLKLQEECDALQELSVTNILLDIVPGEDGMGEEIYARSVDDVTAAMTKQFDLIEGLQEELQVANNACSILTDLTKTISAEKHDLQQCLTVAEQFVQKLINSSKNQDSIATGYLSDILDVINGNNG